LLHENRLTSVPGSCRSDVHQRIRTILFRWTYLGFCNKYSQFWCSGIFL
jgi:hypothetical protein